MDKPGVLVCSSISVLYTWNDFTEFALKRNVVNVSFDELPTIKPVLLNEFIKIRKLGE
jgi:hypothetical protein